MKDFRKDYYTGLKGIYFYSILRTIIRIGDLDNHDVRILDYGCGTGKLKSLLGKNVIGFDVIQELSEVPDWEKVDFNVMVANEVFYLFTEKELDKILDKLRLKNPNLKLIVGIARQSFPGKILKVITREPDAYSGTKLSAERELEVLSRKMHLVKKRSVWSLCDVYLLEFPCI